MGQRLCSRDILALVLNDPGRPRRTEEAAREAEAEAARLAAREDEAAGAAAAREEEARAEEV